jgi:hypothetical protein
MPDSLSRQVTSNSEFGSRRPPRCARTRRPSSVQRLPEWISDKSALTSSMRVFAQSDSLVTTPCAPKSRSMRSSVPPSPWASVRNAPVPASSRSRYSGNNRRHPGKDTPSALADVLQRRVSSRPLPCSAPVKLRWPPSTAGSRDDSRASSSSWTRERSRSTSRRSSRGNSAFQFRRLTEPLRMTSAPAGRSLSVSAPGAWLSPSSTISDARANLDGPSRSMTMSGESSSTRNANSLPFRSSCQRSRPTRPPVARASTRRSSCERSSSRLR